MTYRPTMLPKLHSEALTQSAKGMPCTLRIASFLPHRRCAGPDTTVACHIGNLGKGMSTKVSDISIVYGCLTCHDLADGRDRDGWAYLLRNYEAAVLERVIAAQQETLSIMLAEGLIVVPGGEIVGMPNWPEWRG